MNMRAVCSVIMSVGLAFSCCLLYAQETQPSRPAAKHVSSALPGPVAQLASWPSAEQMTGRTIQPESSRWALNAKRNSIEWMQKVIDPQWLPENPEESLGSKLILLQKAYDSLDTSHIEWQRNGYRFRVSQTKTIFCLSVTPMQGRIADGDAAVKREASRQLALKLVKDVAEVKVPRGEAGKVNVAAGGTRAALMNSSFGAVDVKKFDDGIVAQPARIASEDELDLARWNFWWRRMGWWTDGQTLGLFTLKIEGGAWEADYTSELGKEWFSPPTSTRKSQ